MLFNQVENIIIGLSIFQVIWLFVLSFFLFRTVRHYYRLVGKDKKQTLKKILETILGKVKKQEEQTEAIEKHCQKIEKESLKHFQKIGFLRFNPFSDTGGDQSFVLSFLDGEENGIVLSSLHSRGTTRVYAKTIKKGEGRGFKLSKEEKEVIKRAKRRKF